MLEMLEAGEDPDAPEDAAPVTGEITGYEIDQSDWEALEAVRDGRGQSLPEETLAWLATCGLVEGSPPQATAFAIEWMGQAG